MRGAAIECRVNAEDPVTFAPSPGKITAYSVPGGLGVRVDSAAYENYTVLPYYDSLLAKLIVFAEDREMAIAPDAARALRVRGAGDRTNIPFHRAALAEEAFVAGDYDTRLRRAAARLRDRHPPAAQGDRRDALTRLVDVSRASIRKASQPPDPSGHSGDAILDPGQSSPIASEAPAPDPVARKTVVGPAVAAR